VGSPRKEGNTEIMIQEALAAAREAGAETDIFLIHDKKIEGCDACGACFRTGACKIKDDMTELYRRMEAERRAVASQLRSQGAGEAEKIRAEADKDREIIVAEAYRDAQRVKGDGDARAAAIYAKAFSENPEFYSFYRSLEAYRASFRSRSDVLVLEPGSDFFKYLRSPGKGTK